MFKAGKKTIFTGELDTEEQYISNTPCLLTINGFPKGNIKIEGEVHNGNRYRDLWTASSIDFDRSILENNEVLLIAE
jgi:hypothetical protein